ncbi:MAG: hypothetical protein ACLU99_12930 [Alphaproteobacteria bacterium]
MKKLIAAAVLSLSAVISGSAAAEWSVEEAAGKVQAKADEAGRKIETGEIQAGSSGCRGQGET